MALHAIPDKPKLYPHGTYARIAARLGVTKQAVRLVAIGRSDSARIERELAKERKNAKRRAARAKDRQERGAAQEPANGGGQQMVGLESERS